MTPELSALASALILQIAAIGLMAVIANLELGPKVTLSPRDGTLPAPSLLLGRALRAVQNGFEGLVLFAPAVLLITLSGQSSRLTATAAWVYVAARFLYLPAYLFGLVPWRSLLWAIGLLATVTMILAALR